MNRYEFYFKAIFHSPVVDENGAGWIDCIFQYDGIDLDAAWNECIHHNPVAASTHYLQWIWDATNQQEVWNKSTPTSGVIG